MKYCILNIYMNFLSIFSQSSFQCSNDDHVKSVNFLFHFFFDNFHPFLKVLIYFQFNVFKVQTLKSIEIVTFSCSEKKMVNLKNWVSLLFQHFINIFQYNTFGVFNRLLLSEDLDMFNWIVLWFNFWFEPKTCFD